jgi:hypothetical protein
MRNSQNNSGLGKSRGSQDNNSRAGRSGLGAAGSAILSNTNVEQRAHDFSNEESF